MIIWLASYPKSGNTWVRSFLTSYLYEKKDPLNYINLINQFPQPHQFEGIVDIEKIKKKPDEIFKYFNFAQIKINPQNDIKILKTHNFGGLISGEKFINQNTTAGFIYIVRDPRSVAISLAHHYGRSVDEAIKIMLNEKYYITWDKYLIEFRSSWKNHFLSWSDKNYKKIIVKYEDLHKNPYDTFLIILKFLNSFKKIEVNEKKIRETIDVTSFSRLAEFEKNFKFKESTKHSIFFREGKIDEWKTKLNSNQIKIIEKSFYSEMKSLSYL